MAHIQDGFLATIFDAKELRGGKNAKMKRRTYRELSTVLGHILLWQHGEKNVQNYLPKTPDRSLSGAIDMTKATRICSGN